MEAEKKGPSRRPHTKTRLGCNTCKHRKVRCDLTKPVCQNCTRGNRTCTYSNASHPGSPSILPSPNDLDVELMHHWTVSTYTVVASEPRQHWLWQVFTPRLAFRYPFLLHGILAFAALHRRYLTDDQHERDNLLTIARYHQQQALTLYIPLLQAIDDENCHALFAFSVILTLICYAMLQDSETDEFESLVTRFNEAFDSVIGATAVAFQALDTLQAGEYGAIMTPLEPTVNSLSSFDDGTRESLEALLTCAERVCEEKPGEDNSNLVTQRNAYFSAIFGLASTLTPLPEDCNRGAILAWPVMCQSEFLTMLKQRDPLALVILGNYSVPLHLQHRGLFILDGIAKRLIEAVANEVGAAWHPYLEWARTRIAEPFTPAASTSENP
ncbi:C6 zinc finger domain protein [Zymoseptoria brevis]|uniref:C6 zinc finger domain protein n=1 Tax=Zymoseptoria brevis TaxID=1047168 RepID=A0A0F4GSQ3_9PEZI|nr:C6 zinc finger domain protein [Zymoseptoria brevis]